ncbi:synaptonemal complex protein 1-like isoform X1 [Centruroides sculpturatus]|uniref:synaptonemal complex protein 1-like isoform X1 n=1 Tax=Centruroides sculpturatus TaxID=218467 RepID=UPI000C6E2C88|nr:synaptonemal complex protein 1-like isoform X1 [Centruroides sculpturatus]
MSSPHRSIMEPTYIKPFMLNVRQSPLKESCSQPLGIAKPVENEPRSFESNQTSLTTERIEKTICEKTYSDVRYENHTEHLSSLHSKLYTEAERIRKWKISTEMDIKLKEKKLNDSLQVIESQRKSLLELQLQNESLSQRLSEEMDNRQEILQKISATRELCFVAKNHMDSLEDKICQCEATRLIIEEINKKRVKEYEV